jgi:hypothetical protein
VKKTEEKIEEMLEVDRYYEDESEIQSQILCNTIVMKMGYYFAIVIVFDAFIGDNHF